MNNQEFGFETQAIRNQLERTQFLEHSVPLYLTSSFVFEDAEKTEIFTAVIATQTLTNLLIKFVLWKVLQLVLPLHPEWLRCIQPWQLY
jgi:cystathionine beta-lyase/cystathionine gamma-synthase